ncbi:MAG: hypothetical protein ONB46_16445 [candidate division KSB1 bacterium]|nr:hypothetical protein [candidate division KSB1 bacterium]MDZ7367253.1 hypothetical protein [candidate division KSB1 bacterium]
MRRHSAAQAPEGQSSTVPVTVTGNAARGRWGKALSKGCGLVRRWPSAGQLPEMLSAVGV